MMAWTHRHVQRNSRRACKRRDGRDDRPPAVPLRKLVHPRVGVRRFLVDLYSEIDKDGVTNGAAVLAYYSMLAIFPAAILLLSLLPYLPIPNLEQAIVDLMYQIMPAQAAELFTSTVDRVVSERHNGLVSLGILGTFWAASTGLHAVMQQLNVTYAVKETRPFWKTRGLALLLVVVYGLLVVGAFGLVVFGGILQAVLAKVVGWNAVLLGFFAALRWIIILTLILGALSVMYYVGPNVNQRFRFVSPGGVVAAALLVLASLGFRLYVANFGSYEATYGSIGAAIILLLWLYVAGMVVLVGSEVNSLLEQYAKNSQAKPPH